MRIVLINTRDEHGGAARAAFRLHKGLCEIGQDSTYFVQQKSVDNPTIQQFVPNPAPEAFEHRARCKMELTAAYNAYAATRSPHIELFSQERVDGDEDFFIQRPRADILNLHWVAGFVDYPLFFTQKRTRCPVVWTLHDMNAFTGGCHYDQLCGKYEQSCGACPLLGSDDEQDLSRKVFDAKSTILDAWPAEKLHIVAPSQWLTNEARKSSLFSKFDATTIPYGLETDVFTPTDKQEARAALGLPQDAKIVLFVSNHIGLARKGFRELVHGLSLVPDVDNLMLVGVGDSHVLDLDAPFQVRQLDFSTDDRKTAMMYSAADVTAVPSRQDNLPNTMLESMSCGTPVVAFAVGGIVDVVKHGETGYLARPDNVAELAVAFSEAFADADALNACGRRCRALMESEYALSVQGEAYVALYESVIERSRNADN